MKWAKGSAGPHVIEPARAISPRKWARIFAVAGLAWFLIGFGHPAYWRLASLLASTAGYALFWWATLPCRSVFWPSTFWFALVQMFWLRWMGTCASSSWLALASGTVLSLSMGLQFGLLSHLLRAIIAGFGQKQRLDAIDIAGLSGLWALLEASRLLWWSGFPMNTAGLCLLALPSSRQAASVAGIYGLSLWVVATNLTLFGLFCTPRAPHLMAVLGAMLILPHCSGLLLPGLQSRGTLRVGICATGWVPQVSTENRQLPWSLLRAAQLARPLDLLLLPEGFTPFYASAPLAPFCADGKSPTTVCRVAQGLADELGLSLVIGLAESDAFGAHQCAYHFSPHKVQLPERYIKRVLVPVGEYMPPICPPPLQKRLVHWAQKQGFEHFRPGTRSAIFALEKVRAYPVICYEEFFPNLAEGAIGGDANLLVGLSNDGWYPDSILPEHHFWEAMCRSLEMGLPMVRSANCGLATAVSARGEVLFSRPSPLPGKLEIYDVDLSLATRSTPYRHLRLSGVLGLAALCTLPAAARRIASCSGLPKWS